MEKKGTESVDSTNYDWIIRDETVDLGLPVRETRWWGTQTDEMGAMPTVSAYTTWSWSDNTVSYRAYGDTVNDARSAELVRQFIAARSRKK
jgi:hypothetical protein